MDDMTKINALSTMLRRHIDQVTTLSELLLQEYTALRDSQAEEIVQLAQEKSVLLMALKDLEIEQQQFLRSVLVSDENVQLATAIEKIAPQNPQALLSLNEELKKLAKQCHKQNQINGIVIGLRQQFTDNSLAILRGQNPAAATQLIYGRDGQAESRSGPSSLTKA